MLDRLPLELVDSILRSAADGPKEGNSRREQQRWLAALCTTSKAICNLAQPILYGDIFLEEGSDAEHLERLRHQSKLAAMVRSMRLCCQKYLNGTRLNLGHAFRLFPLVPNLGAVLLRRFTADYLDWNGLAEIPPLAIDFAPTTASHIPASVEMVQTSLTAFSENHVPAHHYPRLDVLTLPLGDKEDLADDVAFLSAPCHWRVIPLTNGTGMVSPDDLEKCLRFLVSYITSTTNPPLSLHLSRNLTQMEQNGVESHQAALEELLAASEKRRIPLRWHDEDTDGEGINIVSESCWRYVKELKAKKGGGREQ
ncbi:hypothetical protein JCM10207_006326 [Rhodosporidiobolus poonsookiae]